MTPQHALCTPHYRLPQFGLREVWPSRPPLHRSLQHSAPGRSSPTPELLAGPRTQVTPLCFCPYCSQLLPCPPTLLSLENSDSSFKPLLKGCLCRGLPDPPRQNRSFPRLPKGALPQREASSCHCSMRGPGGGETVYMVLSPQYPAQAGPTLQTHLGLKLNSLERQDGMGRAWAWESGWRDSILCCVPTAPAPAPRFPPLLCSDRTGLHAFPTQGPSSAVPTAWGSFFFLLFLLCPASLAPPGRSLPWLLSLKIPSPPFLCSVIHVDVLVCLFAACLPRGAQSP